MKLIHGNELKQIYYIGKRFCSNILKNDRVLELLKHRSLLKVTGKDSVELLQGLITNDMRALSNNGVGSLYGMFLNIKGRVMFDTIIYKIPETDTYLLEIDKAASTSVQRHINIYRVRKNVKVENVDHQYNLWVYFNPWILSVDPKGNLDNFLKKATSVSLGTDSAIVLETKNGKVIEFFDPRTTLLGSRIIADKKITDTVYENYGEDLVKLYKMYRYRLGIGEGIIELPTAKCLPLEANCDYLNGVSFNKGCYLGQELTARSYHTGVIRKRYMPLFFYDKNNDEIIDDTVKAYDKNVGVLKGRENNLGLALLRHAEVEDKSLVVDGMKGFTLKPFWWPQDKQNVEKSTA